MCLKPKVSGVTHRYELVEDILNQCTDVTQIIKRAKEKEMLYKYELVRQQGFYNMFDPKSFLNAIGSAGDNNYYSIVITDWLFFIVSFPLEARGREQRDRRDIIRKRCVFISKRRAKHKTTNCTRYTNWLLPCRWQRDVRVIRAIRG